MEGKYQASMARSRYDGYMKGITTPPSPALAYAHRAGARPDAPHDANNVGTAQVFRSFPWQKEDSDRETTGHTPKVLLTVGEAAEALSLGRTLVYELLMHGDLASIKIGSLRRIPVSALDEFVARRMGGRLTGAKGEA